MSAPRHTAPAMAPTHRLLAAGLVALGMSTAHAGGDHPRSRAPLLPLYQQECGACHVAYAPALLPAPSWQRLMSQLPRHFGTDASLDAASTRAITAWLADNAGGARRVAEAPPDDRITRASWFVREHRKVGATSGALPAVRSAANCAACHPAAEQGDFDEHAVRIPR
jgi:hypothetical protein